jgi:hypothetical protein
MSRLATSGLVVLVLAGCGPSGSQPAPGRAPKHAHSAKPHGRIAQLAACARQQGLLTNRTGPSNLRITDSVSGRAARVQIQASRGEAKSMARSSHDAFTIAGRLWVDYGLSPPDALRAPIDICLQTKS